MKTARRKIKRLRKSENRGARKSAPEDPAFSYFFHFPIGLARKLR